jgi:hypothetical protein
MYPHKVRIIEIQNSSLNPNSKATATGGRMNANITLQISFPVVILTTVKNEK